MAITVSALRHEYVSPVRTSTTIHEYILNSPTYRAKMRAVHLEAASRRADYITTLLGMFQRASHMDDKAMYARMLGKWTALMDEAVQLAAQYA